ncbi:aminopeptidase P family protein [Hoeflea prorocentri]|uniref:Aminopeptidase P family protein n=1 Tax=Hoeflea prorocentri TaxID=1922333 RepID=A0A9X3UG14_9HYPH|nr:aminopeptidase P family protein [Hoeflea prorocentri]MCY6379929.1 aminopeptidase P family protein [Hoeflea prorocentri]MDA5397729.1 aminopeptidase P family protein [Hoeflea prorocentri]
MFQNFEDKASADKGKERVELLRTSFDELGIDGFFVPRSDRFQGEYVPESDARLAWLTGFTGSAGIALILRDEAHVFVDGRYKTQVSQQVDTSVFTPQDLIRTPPRKWLEDEAANGLRIGIDPWLHTILDIRALEKAAAASNARIVRLEANPVDSIWTDRPAKPRGAITVQPEEFAGRSAKDKLEAIYSVINQAGADCCLVTDPSSVAWIFNIRGNDVPHTPHPLAFAIIRQDQNRLFADPEQLEQMAIEHLAPLCRIEAPDALETAIRDLGRSDVSVMLDPALTPCRLVDLLTENSGRFVEKPDPARLPRAEKNAIELKGSQNAHKRDGAAMVSFLCWLDRQQPGSVDEIAAVKALEAARRQTGARLQMPLRDISFETISGAGPNGAIIHYRVTTGTCRTLEAGELYLVDSGGQYQDGTTDITRTVPIGTVTDEEKRFFTLVLKGMIALTLMRFPEGTRGVDLDVIARSALWKAGADYAHGTGHGVGSYLSVHEGPQGISKRGIQELKPGMILSNEPGYYREGAFGIRIENLIYVTEPQPVEGGDTSISGFETLTLCPIDRRLIVPELLSPDELDWLNAYHRNVRETLTPLLQDADEKDWLARMTSSIAA